MRAGPVWAATVVSNARARPRIRDGGRCPPAVVERVCSQQSGLTAELIPCLPSQATSFSRSSAFKQPRASTGGCAVWASRGASNNA